jgi:hypothetical protein
MFGGGVNENVTLTMREQRPGSLPAHASMWLVVVSPATKFAMTMAPIAMALEVRACDHATWHTSAVVPAAIQRPTGVLPNVYFCASWHEHVWAWHPHSDGLLLGFMTHKTKTTRPLVDVAGPSMCSQRLGLTRRLLRLPQELGPAAGSKGAGALSLGVRTLLLLLVLGVALTVPFFALVMAFIGALLSMSVSVVAPCIFHLAICGARLRPWQVALNVGVAVLGVAAGGCSTYESVRKIVLSGT